MFDLEELCGNCRHWLGKAYGELAECAVNAVKPDLGIAGAKCVVLLPASGDCRGYDEAFDPEPDYLTLLHEWEHQNDGL